jgi:hypothetical protein
MANLAVLIPVVVSMFVVPNSLFCGLRNASALRRQALDEKERAKALRGFVVGLVLWLIFGMCCILLPPFSSFFGLLGWTLVASPAAIYLPSILVLLSSTEKRHADDLA